MMSAYERLNQLAAELVGDGKSPNLYFVTEGGRVTTITTDRRTAYLHWRQLAAGAGARRECALEDRERGVLCSVDPGEHAGAWRVRDDYSSATGDRGIAGWQAAQLIDYARSERQRTPPAPRHTVCRYCGQDIEGVPPFIRGEWRDRGNNRHCNDGAHAHAPVLPTRPA